MNEKPTAEQIVRAMLDATDAKDTAAKLPMVSEDVTLTFGNSETTTGKEAFAAASDTFNGSIARLSHETKGLWTVVDGGNELVFADMLVHYTRLDGGRVTLPCLNTFRVRDGLISDYRIYMDIAPVYA